MTRLTKNDRRAVVDAIMAATPAVDYKTQIQAAVLAKAVASLPPVVRNLWQDSSTRPLLEVTHLYIHWPEKNYVKGRYSIADVAVPGFKDVVEGFEEHEDIVFLREAAAAQADVRDDLERKLTASFADCTTVKTFEERFPDLVSYLPTGAQSISLPATTDLMDSLRGAGLPIPKEEQNV